MGATTDFYISKTNGSSEILLNSSLTSCQGPNLIVSNPDFVSSPGVDTNGNFKPSERQKKNNGASKIGGVIKIMGEQITDTEKDTIEALLSLNEKQIQNPIIYDKALDELNKISESRRLRYFYIGNRVPGLIWIVLIAGCLMAF